MWKSISATQEVVTIKGGTPVLSWVSD